MNILFLSTENPFPIDHGHHIRTFHTLQALAQDYKVFFICFTQNDVGLCHRNELEKYCEAVHIVNIGVSRFSRLTSLLKNLFSPLPFIAEKYYHPEAVELVRSLIHTHKIDIVHVDMLHLANYKFHINEAPTILVNHNVESLRIKRWAQVEKNPFLKAFLLYQGKKTCIFEQNMCALFDLVITVSDADKMILERLCSSGRFKTIPNGIDIHYFSPQGRLNTERRQIVWTGGMASPYNRDAVIFFINDIWPKIIREIPDVTATFVGVSPPYKLINLSRTTKNVKVTGYVNDVRPFVAEADVFIAPLRAGSGTKIKVLNAMAQGKAVVSTSIGIEGITAHPEKEVLIADTAPEFAEKIVSLLLNPNRAYEIGKRARELVMKRYDSQIIGCELRELYKGIISTY
jgi:glycosyltransferase involved in cell wall biosynthesis